MKYQQLLHIQYQKRVMKLHVSHFMKNLENKPLLLEHLMTGGNYLGRLLVYYRSQAGQEVLTAMGHGTCSSQRGASNAFGISVSSVNRIVKSSPFKQIQIQNGSRA